MAQRGWSSLPEDLVNRVADCLLVTNGLDCYMDLRAVCQNWRSGTVDPRSNQHDPRFRPRQWVMLDEHELSSFPSRDGVGLFVNATTGRFLRKNLAPLLRGYDFVTSSTGGFLVLADRGSLQAAIVVNPFTGSLIRFAAPLPMAELRLTAHVVGSSLTLFLASVQTNMVYWAETQSESFSVERHSNCPASRLPLIAAGKRAAAGCECDASKILDLLVSVERRRCYVVDTPGGDTLAVLKRPQSVDVFKIDIAGNVIQQVRSIGTLALFLGVRCLVIDADRFPTIESNCAYFQLIDSECPPVFIDVVDETVEREVDIYSYKFGIEEDEAEWVSATMSETDWRYGRSNLRPSTLAQLLCNYTMNIPHRPVTWERHSSLDYSLRKEYIDSHE